MFATILTVDKNMEERTKFLVRILENTYCKSVLLKTQTFKDGREVVEDIPCSGPFQLKNILKM